MEYVELNGNMTLLLSNGQVRRHDSHPEQWLVPLIDTGLEAETVELSTAGAKCAG